MQKQNVTVFSGVDASVRRSFKTKTFRLPNRGEKEFMLAAECARVLKYNDFYLLFYQNSSLDEIVATQEEKDCLIHQNVFPNSNRSAQIILVAAKSILQLFGSKMIDGGPRIYDDSWEAQEIQRAFSDDRMFAKCLDLDGMGSIRSKVHGVLSSSTSTTSGASLVMQWDPLNFIRSQFVYHDQVLLGSVIVINGFAGHTQATTCSQYVHDIWPWHGARLLKVFQRALDGNDSHNARGSPPSYVSAAVADTTE